MSSDLAIIVHGGAGRYPERLCQDKPPQLKAARELGWKALTKGASAVEVVAVALGALEAAECFNAGYGAYPNQDGKVFLDAGIMDGSSRAFASLINVSRVKYPSQLVLDMLKRKEHYMCIWTDEHQAALDKAKSADKKRYGWVKSEAEMLSPYVERLHKEEDGLEIKRDKKKEDKDRNGTVGCVVRDKDGHIAAGTSTGGVSHKPLGRVGDSPVIGAGVYADDKVCALSTTGHGEAILETALSGYVISAIREALKQDGNCFKKDEALLEKLLGNEFKNFEAQVPQKTAAMIVMPSCGKPAYGMSACNLTVSMSTGSKAKIKEEYTRLFFPDRTFKEL